MTKSDIIKFIRENKESIRLAPVDQKIRLLKLIRETLNQPDQKQTPPSPPSNSDYLEER